MSEPAPTLPPPEGPVDLLLVAGEHSGDEHAARLVAELRALRPHWRVAALGGPLLQRAGAQLLLDLTRHSVVGLAEVLRHYGFFRDLLAETAGWVTRHRPRAVCLVDYPGFNLRLAARLAESGYARSGGGPGRLLYYISPQIWAWKAHRRHRMATLLDGLAVIFPFEVECYRDTPLSVQFVGHPLVAPDHPRAVHHDPAGPVLLLPGSRLQPVGRIFPVLAQTWAAFRRERPEARAVVPYPSEAVRHRLESVLAAHPEARAGLTLQPVGTGLGARAALTSSGTMSLTCALAGLPGAIVYRAHPLTYRLGRLLVRVPHLGIANLLLPEDPPYPEFLQGRARPDALLAELRDLCDNPDRARRAQAAAVELRRRLDVPAGLGPAAWLVQHLEHPA